MQNEIAVLYVFTNVRNLQAFGEPSRSLLHRTESSAMLNFDFPSLFAQLNY